MQVQGTVPQIWEVPEHYPKALNDAFKNAPAMCKRLLSGWEYVGSADIQIQPNIPEYYKGTKANWSLIDAAAYFERDVEEELYDMMAVRDVNSYLAVYQGGKIKRIGAYAHETAEENPGTRELPYHK